MSSDIQALQKGKLLLESDRVEACSFCLETLLVFVRNSSCSYEKEGTIEIFWKGYHFIPLF